MLYLWNTVAELQKMWLSRHPRLQEIAHKTTNVCSCGWQKDFPDKEPSFQQGRGGLQLKALTKVTDCRKNGGCEFLA